MKNFTILLTILLTFALTASAEILYVPGEYSTIQAGIDASVNGDTVMVADGTYAGSGNKNLDFLGKNIVLISENGPESCIINCGNYGRGFYFHSGESSTAVVSGFTVKNGNSSYGGGVNVTNSSPTLEYCIIRENSSSGSYGGGVYVSNGAPAFYNCTMFGNTALYGGAMYATNTTMIVNSCIIAENLSSG